MIIEYHRPRTLKAAIDLLARTKPATRPMGGGTVLSRMDGDQCAVVDLQELGLDKIFQEGNLIRIGAAATLQQIFESRDIHESLRQAAHRETSLNLRQVSTVAGTIVSAGGRSILTAVLLAADARLIWAPGDIEVSLGDYLPMRPAHGSGKLITEIRVPSNTRIWFETVSRSPDDLPTMITAAVRWPSGRTRISVGGFGKAAVLAMDGTEPGGAVEAVRQAASGSDDEWASAEYRMETGAILINRCLQHIEVL